MTDTSSIAGFRRAFTMRGIAVLIVTAAYLLSGLLHGACEFDVDSPSGRSVIAEMSMPVSFDRAPHSDGGIVAGHHCHGCFSVSIPAPPQPAAAAVASKSMVIGRAAHPLGDVARALDPPPPKALI